MGLETIHPEVLPRLNKRMTLAEFESAARFLRGHGIAVRAFLLLRPPYLSEAEGVHWAKRSLDYAFDVGVQCCVIIPTRTGNGAMERLQAQALFEPPRVESLEEVVEYGIALHRGRMFADLWDIERFYACERCGPVRKQRLHAMNLTQQIVPRVVCPCQEPP
jgi:radical SAM enzyme (TIGR01210 family)